MNKDIKKILPIFTLGIISIIVIDYFGVIIEYYTKINFWFFAILSLITNILFPYLIAKKSSKIITIGCSILFGLFDSTIGYKLSSIVKDEYHYPKVLISSSQYLLVIIFHVTYYFLLGYFAWWLAIKKSKSAKIKEEINELFN